LENPEYIKFVISRVEAGLAGYDSSSEYGKVAAILNSMKSADNILREAYVLTGIKKLRKFAFYIIFIYKKIESNRITIDNFLENFKADREFLLNYLQTYYNLETAEEPEPEEPETEKFNVDDLHETEKEEEIYSLSESKFRIEILESKLVNEEFIESKPLSDLEILDDRYMRLVEQDKSTRGTIPEGQAVPEEGDVFSLYVNIRDTVKDKLQEAPEKTQDKETKPESETEIKSKSLADFFEQLDNEEKSWLAKPEETRDTSSEKLISEEETQNPVPEINEEGVPVSEKEIFLPQGTAEKTIIIETDNEIDSKLKEIEKETTDEIANADFLRYESE